MVVALIFLLQALGRMVDRNGLATSFASLSVGAAIAAIALAAVVIAKSRLTAARLLPSRTIEQAAKTVGAVRGRA